MNTLAWSQSENVHAMPVIPAAMESILANGCGSVFCLAPCTRLNTMTYLASLPAPIHIHHPIRCSIFKYSAIDCSVSQDISALRRNLHLSQMAYNETMNECIYASVCS
jgi:hypothetical protein